MLLRGRVIYQKMLWGNSVAEISLINKMTIISVSINENDSVEKIIGRLVVQKRVCDQKLLQKTVCARTVFDTEKVKTECVSRRRGFMTEKNIFFVFLCQKIVVDEKGCLENLCRKSHSPKSSRIKKRMMEIFLVKASLYQRFFNIEEFSEQNLWSVKPPKGAVAKTKVRCQKLYMTKLMSWNKYNFHNAQ